MPPRMFLYLIKHRKIECKGGVNMNELGEVYVPDTSGQEIICG